MKGKIYIIRSHQTDDVYYGSTTQKYLSSRFSSHKSVYKKWLNNDRNYITSFEIIKYEDCYIELVEEVEYETKEQLKAKERFYIRNNKCVNKYIPNRTQKEYYQDNKDKYQKQHKEYVKDNEEKIKEYQKEYCDKNRDKKKEYDKEYQEKNNNKYKKYQKEYRDNNRDKKKEYQKEYYKKIKNAEA